MKFFNPTDIYDNIIRTIQQFPMEVYYFKRHTERIDAIILKYQIRLTKLIKKLPKKNEKKFHNVTEKLVKMHKKKLTLVNRLENKVKEHICFFLKLNELGNNPIDITQCVIQIKNPMIIKLKNEVDDNKTYCTCNGRAFGSMICCDNIECEVHWYHFKCVGLIKTPKIPWICDRCIDRNK